MKDSTTERSIVDLQLRDHAQMNELIRRYVASTSAGRSAIFREFVDLVTRHAFAEEEVLFPAARRILVNGEPLTREIEAYHQRANDLLKEMERFAPGDARFEYCAQELFLRLKSDAHIEEERLLPPLQRAVHVDELVRIGGAWQLAKAAAPNRSHPNVPRRPPWNAVAGVPLFVVDHVRSFFARLRGAPQ